MYFVVADAGGAHTCSRLQAGTVTLVADPAGGLHKHTEGAGESSLDARADDGDPAHDAKQLVDFVDQYAAVTALLAHPPSDGATHSSEDGAYVAYPQGRWPSIRLVP